MKQNTPQNNRTKLPHEVFELVEKASSVADRVKILQENATFGIKTLLQINFREDIEFDLPEGVPPYRVNQGVPGQQYRSFEKLVYELKNLIKQSPLPKFKKEMIYIKMLEGLYSKDAEIVIAVKDKNLKSLYKSLTEATVRKAYPTLLKPKE